MTQTIQGLSEIANRYDGFIIDLFGVIHNGVQLYPDTISTLQNLKDKNKAVCFLSNSPRRAESARGQCISMGLPEELTPPAMTSGEATYAALSDFVENYGPHCWFLGNTIVKELKAGLGTDLADGPEKADFILNAIPGTGPTHKAELIENLKIAAARKTPMICANPDLVVHVGEHLYECAGTFAKIYEEMGGPVTYFGKPHLPVYERAHDLIGNLPKEKICAIGDSFHTDIAGAQAFGIDSIFNLAGIHREELGLDPATKSVDSKALQDLIARQTHMPTYVMEGFTW